MPENTTGELNKHLAFNELTPEAKESFSLKQPPVLVRLEKGFELYKWTQYPFLDSKGRITVFWSPWTTLDKGGFHAPGFAELRVRYANQGGSVGRMQEFVRARNAVTKEWNNMQSITKARLKLPVWGFLGVCAPKHLSTELEKQRLKPLPPGVKPPAEVILIGGDCQLVIPNLTPNEIQKL